MVWSCAGSEEDGRQSMGYSQMQARARAKRTRSGCIAAAAAAARGLLQPAEHHEALIQPRGAAATAREAQGRLPGRQNQAGPAAAALERRPLHGWRAAAPARGVKHRECREAACLSLRTACVSICRAPRASFDCPTLASRCDHFARLFSPPRGPQAPPALRTSGALPLLSPLHPSAAPARSVRPLLGLTAAAGGSNDGSWRRRRRRRRRGAADALVGAVPGGLLPPPAGIVRGHCGGHLAGPPRPGGLLAAQPRLPPRERRAPRGLLLCRLCRRLLSPAVWGTLNLRGPTRLCSQYVETLQEQLADLEAAAGSRCGALRRAAPAVLVCCCLRSPGPSGAPPLPCQIATQHAGAVY